MGTRVPVKMGVPPRVSGSLRSKTTDLWFKREGQRLRMIDVPTGERILWSEEQKAARVMAEAKAATAAAKAESEAAKAAEESAARQAAEERIQALEAELRSLRKG